MHMTSETEKKKKKKKKDLMLHCWAVLVVYSFLLSFSLKQERQQTTMTIQMHVYAVGYHSVDDTLGYVLTVWLFPLSGAPLISRSQSCHFGDYWMKYYNAIWDTLMCFLQK